MEQQRLNTGNTLWVVFKRGYALRHQVHDKGAGQQLVMSKLVV